MMAMLTTLPRTLESGDHLTPEEFDAIYETFDGRAELINGVVYVTSPVTMKDHARSHGALAGLLFVYAAHTPGTEWGVDGSVHLPDGTRVQPDLSLYRPESARFSGGYLASAPVLTAEVAVTSASNDLHEKKDAYRRNGVREYLVWRVLEDAIDLFALEGGEYIAIEPDGDGVLHSREFPGLAIDVPALVSGHASAALETLQRALNARS